jgi:pilus assembly protein CpaF
MAELQIMENQVQVSVIKLDNDKIIGKSAEADIQLDRRNISRKHCRVFKQNGHWLVEDMDSRNGTWLNNYRLEKPMKLMENHQIVLGDYHIVFKEGAKAAKATPKAVTPVAVKKVPVPPKKKAAPRIPIKLKQAIHARLIDDNELKAIANDDEEALEVKTREVVSTLVSATRLPPGVTPEELIQIIMNEALGLGPLEEFLIQEEVTEIMVNNWDTIFLEKAGKIVLSDSQFTDNQQLLNVIRRILAPIGRRIDETSPLVDARLKDGSRVNAIIPPLALNGPTLTIRKFAKDPFTVDDLIRFGSMTRGIADLLQTAVEFRQNILISGGTGTGKTTLLNVISSFIPDTERIVTIEDAAELRLMQEHVVRLESRPANIEGEGAITIRRLVMNSLRMRPDRIVVGECRGGEALDMLQAMNTGHDGSLSTLHANTPRDALARLETLVLMAGMELPALSIRQQIASAVNLFVQISRFQDGTRCITNITEVTGMEGDVISMAEIFTFNHEGYDEEGNILGSLSPTGTVPKFIHKMREAKLPVDMSMFMEKTQ